MNDALVFEADTSASVTQFGSFGAGRTKASLYSTSFRFTVEPQWAQR